MTSRHDEHSRLTISFNHDTELVPRLHAYVASIHQIDTLREESNSPLSRLSNLPDIVIEHICNILLEISYVAASRQWKGMEECRLHFQRQASDFYPCCIQYSLHVTNEGYHSALRHRRVQNPTDFREVEKLVIFENECEFRHYANVKRQFDETMRLTLCPVVSGPLETLLSIPLPFNLYI